jgi:hypothetical protein
LRSLRHPEGMDLEASLDWRDQSTHYPSSVESADSCSGSACDVDVINSRAAPALGALPPEVIELIGFELACLTPFDAPRDLVSLCLVSKRFQQILSLRSNSRLYARLFKARFDVAALRRRLGLLRGKVLAEEFVGRMVFMSRLKRSVARKRLFEGDEQEGQAQLLGDFWMAFMMMLEHGELPFGSASSQLMQGRHQEPRSALSPCASPPVSGAPLPDAHASRRHRTWLSASIRRPSTVSSPALLLDFSG